MDKATQALKKAVLEKEPDYKGYICMLPFFSQDRHPHDNTYSVITDAYIYNYFEDTG